MLDILDVNLTNLRVKTHINCSEGPNSAAGGTSAEREERLRRVLAPRPEALSREPTRADLLLLRCRAPGLLVRAPEGRWRRRHPVAERIVQQRLDDSTEDLAAYVVAGEGPSTVSDNELLSPERWKQRARDTESHLGSCCLY